MPRHIEGLAVTGITVLVTAGGVDRPYPRAHEDLYGRIIVTGAVISELPLGTAAARHRFLTRNRLVAAPSRGTVIVEAARRSGTSATASAAEELRRHVMAPPGPVTSICPRAATICCATVAPSRSPAVRMLSS